MTPPNRDLFLETADRIGARICRDAIWSGRECNWIARQYDDSYQALPPLLYGGTSGIAWFLLHLFAATKERVFRITAEGALSQALTRSGSRVESPGFHAGASGIAFVAAWAARIAVRDDYAEHSRRLLRAANPLPERIDVVDGSAGAIPALLFADREYPGEGFLDQAVRHGEFLIGSASRAEMGWSWRTTAMHEAHLTGFAHGAAGIGWALLELFRATGDAKFREAGLQAFAYEQSLFDAEEQNWPDLRSGLGDRGRNSRRCMSAWCHGAPGIGLARLRAFEILGDGPCRAQAETAIRTTNRSLAALDNYSLCHGASGNAELLLCAAAALKNPACADPAYRIAEAGIERFERQRAPWPCGYPGEGETPTLMIGTSGIGYFLLRLYDPVRFPSILLPI